MSNITIEAAVGLSLIILCVIILIIASCVLYRQIRTKNKSKLPELEADEDDVIIAECVQKNVTFNV